MCVWQREREREIIIFLLLKHDWKLDSKGIRVIHNDFNGLYIIYGLPWWSRSKEHACQCKDMDSIPGSGRLPGEGNGNPQNAMNRGAWQATVHGVAKESDMT